MMNVETVKSKFSKNLFWDIDIRDLDLEQHKPYILGRILEFGQLSDWILIRQYYGLDEIRRIAMDMRIMSPQALSYLSLITHTPENQFRCYTLLQSPDRPWHF
jgi:hypothetical protein